MTGLSTLRTLMTMTDEGMDQITEGMKPHALVQPTSTGGNHTLWTLGHLAWVEGAFGGVIAGRAHPLEAWTRHFSTGSVPVADASAYPAYDEVVAAMKRAFAATAALLEELGEAGLDKPPRTIPPGFEPVMQTVGQSFALLAMHRMTHYGQIADCRRVAGLPPLL